jgi:transmembrane sensor
MQPNKDRFIYLVHQYLDKTATAVEFKELFELIEKEENKELLFDLMKDEDRKSYAIADVHTIDWDTMYGQIVQPARPVRRRLFSTISLAVAATLICLLGIGIYFGLAKYEGVPAIESELVQNDVTPGGDKAMLRLADGTEIELNQSASGVLTAQGNTEVSKMEEGLLVYKAGHQDKDAEVVYNTLSTPRGGKYMLVLPDNSKVWLNSASSITFPTKFDGMERAVKITGEVYFEIAKRSGQTFTVQTTKAKVEVLGTHFNVMSYADEASEEVTLLEGSIRLSLGQSNKILTPGQLAFYGRDSEKIGVKNLDLPESKIDWKNGVFEFENESIEQIMRKVSRWYDRDIVYAGAKINKHFTGTIPRNNNVSKILNLLKKSGGLNFEISDKTIKVTE